MQPKYLSIPANYNSNVVYDIAMYAQGAVHVKITVEAQAYVILHDSGIHDLDVLELILQRDSQVFFVTSTHYRQISIICHEKSSVSLVQVIGSKVASGAVQHLVVSMQGIGSRACVRIMPLLQHDKFECHTEQVHANFQTSSDIYIVGSIHGPGHFGNKSKVVVPSGMHDVHITQKTLMFLIHAKATAYAVPCFDVASKDIHCTHGAALGSLDEGQLWYVQSRGLSRNDAQNILPQACCMASLDPELPAQVQKMVYAMIESR